jgi:prepilin-type N-terminal cleavage/methylation domain-containing protein
MMRWLKSKKGFTLIEIMVALLIAAIVLAAVYEVFLSDYRAFISHNLLLDTHQKEKMALEFMSREIQLIGFDAETNPITADVIKARADYIQFEEYDVNDNRRVKILYEFRPSEEDIIRRLNLFDTSCADPNPENCWIAGTDEEFIDNVVLFTFTYYKEDHVEIVPVYDPVADETKIAVADIPDIRQIDVELVVKTESKDPIRKKYLTRKIETSIYVRNLGIDTNLLDTTPPDPPINVTVADPNVCGELVVSWNANTEADLSGYVIYFGLEDRDTFPYPSKIVISDPKATTFTLTGLDNAPSEDPASLMYYIAMSAFDRSMNMSDYSAEVSGDGSIDNDTIPNPDKPSPAENFIGEEVSSEGEVKLTWFPSADTDVVGYRIYRSNEPFNTYPIVAPYNPSNLNGTVMVASEDELISTPNVLTKDDAEFIDTGLIGCKKYYYAIAAVNCDTTLISDDAGDDDSIRYIQSDYRFTNGDGISGPDTDFPTGSDTTPGDLTAIDDNPYPVPDLSSKAGWKRVFLSLTNPNRSDDPDFSRTDVYFNDTSFPILNPDGTVSDGNLLPDNGGTFTGEGTLPPVIFDSRTIESPPEPDLEIFQTYYFIAISYDLCGNTSNVSEHCLTLSELCGDDPDYLGAPPVPAGLTSEGCYSYAYLSWNHQGSFVVDLAGYHIYRSEGSTFDLASSTELTEGAPQWFSYFMDTGVVEGGIYSYGIRATDCYYENIDPANPDYANAKANNISDPVVLEGIRPGRVTMDDLLVHAVTGDITVSPSTYYHNTVTFYIENTSASSLTITDMEVEWENLSAYLSEVYIGDDDIDTMEDCVWTGTASSGSQISINKILLDYGSPGSGSVGIPVTLVFTDEFGNVNRDIDLREDTLIISMTYLNNSMPSTIMCEFDAFKYIPLGPTIVGVTQDKPTVATIAWPVPGEEGTNPMEQVIVPGGVSISISAHVYDNSNVGIKDVNLYYYVDELSMYDELTGPPPEYDSFNNPNYTHITMNLVGGSLYKSSSNIPASDDATIWYFIMAEDWDGNFDRSPEVESGVYTYYQQEGDVCNNTPAPPDDLFGFVSASGDSVDLDWLAPTLNEDGSPIDLDLQGYNVYRNDGTGWVKINENIVTDIYYTDSDLTALDVSSKDYTYYVTALDFCEPIPNEGGPSNLFTECEGAAACSVNVNKTEINPGDPLLVSIMVCLKINGSPDEIIYLDVCSGGGDADPIRMIEDDDTGVFYIDSTYYGRDYIQTYLIGDYPASPIGLDTWVDPTDTITIGGYEDPDPMAPAPDNIPYHSSDCETLWDGTLTTFDCSVLIDVEEDPCTTTPEAPILAITGTGNPNASNGWIELSWTPPTLNTDGSTINDLAGYKIYRSDNGSAFVLVNTISDALVTTWMDSGLGKLRSNQYEYYITAIDICVPPVESAQSNTVTDPH